MITEATAFMGDKVTSYEVHKKWGLSLTHIFGAYVLVTGVKVASLSPQAGKAGLMKYTQGRETEGLLMGEADF